ncbi:hypothetical protein CTEN210_00710 [Chaetoceros tenuissimus]|uniref:CRAL-TRIO domain-containing protein n=1 Tax=Chaetoceros tenuissimus TaxID=426638 RepID=A0AAD3GYY7_9STRA|nr:hypothetical protein CTEN210_00710 [Chaetoceros tenuissimus]
MNQGNDPRKSLRISLVGNRFQHENDRQSLISSLRQSLWFLIPEKNKKPLATNVIFDVTDEECDEMFQALSQDTNAPWHEEVKYLSKSWVKAVMSQPYRKNKKMRRPFDYAKKKIVDYLDWRAKNNITKEIAYYSALEDGKEFTKVLKTGGHDLYWYGVDKDGCPNLWYRADMTIFEKVEVRKTPKASALIMQAALDKMPSNIHNFNFIVVFDKFNVFKAMSKPTLAPAFVRTFLKISPDRLKPAYFITGGAGGFFFDIAAKIAPASVMDKTTKCKSREEAADLLQRDGILKTDEIPTFMGGEYEQDENIMRNYSRMMKEIEKAMYNEASTCVHVSSNTLICRGHF